MYLILELVLCSLQRKD